MIRLLTPKADQTVCLLSEKHLAYIKNPKNDPTSKIDWLALREDQEDQSFPVPLVFTYTPFVDGEIILRAKNGQERIIATKNGAASVQNLRIGEEYEWFVRIGSECSETRRFTTDPQFPRFLFVDGISNARDFGGFQTTDGKYVRQDMIYRTSELDTHVEITRDGIRTLEDELRVRTDLDFRGIHDEPRCPILDEGRVRWVNVPLAAYESIYTEEQMKRYAESYSILADPKSYPLIVHCWGGIDRTGCWLYILGGMLGVHENDLGLDYEMSSFSRWSRRSRYSDQFKAFLEGLYRYGDDLQSACIGFMKACGITDEQMEAIRSLLLQKSV